MKKIKNLFFVVALMLTTSCTPLVRSEYQCVVKYTLCDTQIVDTVYVQTSENCTPIILYKEHVLYVSAFPTHFWHTDKVIYEGCNTIKVDDFSYTLTRTYEVSHWDGHEIDKKPRQ